MNNTAYRDYKYVSEFKINHFDDKEFEKFRDELSDKKIKLQVLIENMLDQRVEKVKREVKQSSTRHHSAKKTDIVGKYVSYSKVTTLFHVIEGPCI